jgi:hypothetical protein
MNELWIKVSVESHLAVAPPDAQFVAIHTTHLSFVFGGGGANNELKKES